MTSHEKLAADDGPAVEAQDVRTIEDIAMEAGAMAVEDDLERALEWAKAARKRLIQLGRPDVVLAVHVIENVAIRNALQSATPDLTRNRIRNGWMRGSVFRR